MICYACNTNYPEVGPEPFWICPNCKSNQYQQSEQPKILTAQKPFYEIEKPAKTKELVVIARWIDSTTNIETAPCMQMVGNGLCCVSASWTCWICNRWTCDLHESKEKTLHGNAICEECGKLSTFDMEQVYAFRERLSRA